VNVIGVVPLHTPRSAVNVEPSRAVPEIDGRVVTDGGTAATSAVCVDGAPAEPAPFVPSTTRRSASPTSADVVA
jgi:hypothetical protein